MKTIGFITLVIAAFALQVLFNCSSPLDVNDLSDGSAAPETVFVHDTTIVIDTIIVVVPDTGFSQLRCSSIEGPHAEILWLLMNEAGNYAIEFQASVERSHPEQTLSLNIDGQEFQWDLQTTELLFEGFFLREDTEVRITTVPPHARGHSITVCMRIRIM